jgi:hypothetical protein
VTADESDLRVPVGRALARRLACPLERLQRAIEGRELPCWVDERGGRWVDWEGVQAWWWAFPGDEQDRYWDSAEAAAWDRPARRTRRPTQHGG